MCLSFYQVHVAGAGDFQLCKIEVLKDPVPLNPRMEQDAMDTHDVEVIIYFLLKSYSCRLVSSLTVQFEKCINRGMEFPSLIGITVHILLALCFK